MPFIVPLACSETASLATCRRYLRQLDAVDIVATRQLLHNPDFTRSLRVIPRGLLEPQTFRGLSMQGDNASPKSTQPDTSGLVWSHRMATGVLEGAGDVRVHASARGNKKPVTSDRDRAHGLEQGPTQTSIWDWNISQGIIDDHPSYDYELQGELLQSERNRRPAKTEFTIPQPIITTHSGSASVHRSTDSSVASNILHGISSTGAGAKRKSTSDRNSLLESRQPESSKRLSRSMSESVGNDQPSPRGAVPGQPVPDLASRDIPASRTRRGTDAGSSRTRTTAQDNSDTRNEPRRTLTDSSIPMVLPARKVFPIQIGDKMFRLSGASISSDEQLRQNHGADNIRTLYVDRDPATFEDISLHLKGYHIKPRDGSHFVKLFADAQFFSLPRLTAQLFSSTIYIRIGDEEFQIPRDLFSSPGDSPNYFSLGFSIFFNSPTEVFPGLTERTLLRPPAILPPSVPNRSAKTFADILHILKGYPPEFRNEEHRNEILRDARYFHLKGLEQRLISHSITYNLARKRSEILLKLEDLRQSGVSIVYDNSDPKASATSPDSSTSPLGPSSPGWVFYRRPYVDAEAYSLIVEVSGEEGLFLSVAPGSRTSPARAGRATFHHQALARITGLFSVIASKMNLPVSQPLGLMMMERGGGVASMPVSPGTTGLSEDRVKVRIGSDADVIVDGRSWSVHDDEDSDMDIDVPTSSASSHPRRKRRRPPEQESEGEDWVVRKSQWRLRVQPLASGAQPGRSGVEVILGAVKIEAFSDERARNVERQFLA
nr:uncharacterized protein CFP56_54961 [Quercus suber]